MDFYAFRERNQHRASEEAERLATVVIGAAIEVHRHLGPALPEKVYRDALAYELELLGVDRVIEAPVPVIYKGKEVGEGRTDLLVGGLLVIELKVVESLSDVHRAQVIAYLQALSLELGLLLNFNVAIMKDGIKRVMNTFRPS